MKSLMEELNEFDLFLVGIGEEFEGNQILSENVNYQIIREMLQDHEEYNWLLPFFQHEFLLQNEKYMQALKGLESMLEGRNYFIVSTVMNEMLYETKLNQERMVSPCGGFSFSQCVQNCNDEVVLTSIEQLSVIRKLITDGENITYSMIEKTLHMQCDHCHGELGFHNLYLENYNEKGYMEQWQKYQKWLQGTLNRKLCVLEFGVGLKYPTIVRWPFEKVTFFNLKAKMYRVHKSLYQLTEEIKDRGVSIQHDAIDFLAETGTILSD